MIGATTDLWTRIKNDIRQAIDRTYGYEEVLAVDDETGAVTVRAYGTDAIETVPRLRHAYLAPGDRTLVLRLPGTGLKVALGATTQRDAPEPALVIPFLGRGGRYGTSERAARGDHVHSTEDFVPIAQVWNTWVPHETPNNATPVDIGSQVLNLPKGVWSFNVVAEATMFRSVDTGGVWLSVRMQNAGTRDTDLSESRNTGVVNVREKEPIRVPFARHARIKLDAPGSVTFTVRYRGESTLGTTYAKMVLLTGYVWRVG